MLGGEPSFYVTVNAAVKDGQFNVVVMKWDHTQDEYVVHKVSAMLLKPQAEALARSWAAAMGNVEIR